MRAVAAVAAMFAACSSATPTPHEPWQETKPTAGGCFLEHARPKRCGGAAVKPLPPGERPPEPPLVDVCHRCLSDAHCAARPDGRCVLVTAGDPCGQHRRVCLYPGDTCYPPGACPEGQQCYVGPEDVAYCSEPPSPNP